MAKYMLSMRATDEGPVLTVSVALRRTRSAGADG